MAHPYHHAESSARRYGGAAQDYLPIHDWFDQSKEFLAAPVHRALRHHCQGIFEAERVFGPTLTNSAGRVLPTRWIGEQHVVEDCRIIPSLGDWLTRIKPAPWMGYGQILNSPDAISGDPAIAWREAVATQRTILGFKEWLADRTAMQAPTQAA